MDHLAAEPSTTRRPAPEPTRRPTPERHPRPEAVALGWGDMLKNTRAATEALIHWLITAIAVSESKKPFTKDSPQLLTEQLATSVLVAGDRGFGKTTVLLSAANAFQRPDDFIPPPKNGQQWADGARRLNQELKDHQNSIVWLDPLDMEPLPPDANLLATLLVRVQNSLRPDWGDKDGDQAGSALLAEEGLDEPWAKIGQLVREASFMWEKSPAQGVDAREHVANQIKAADIYATFRRNFFVAIDRVASFQARQRFGRGSEKQVILVLPIDNVDRSIQHLNLILKLIRMVASPRLWFLLASGGQEFQLFLERTFQREMSEAGQLALGAQTLDTSMAIARRQAAGAIRRVLPRVHRIDIEPLPAEDLWAFTAPKSMAGAGEKEDRKPIRDFLKKLPLPGEPCGLKSLADLFDVRERLSLQPAKADLLLNEYLQVLKKLGDSEEESAAQDGPAPVFTHAAKLALSISARAAVDLWHEARGACQEVPPEEEVPPGKRGEQAIQLASRMLRMAIDESNLPSWASELLLHRVLRKDAQKRIFLDLTQELVRRLKLTTLSDALEWPTPEPEGLAEGHALRSELHLRHVMDIILVLQDPDVPGRSVHLPANVTGWYMMLHDLLALTADGRVLTQRIIPFDVTPQLVVTRHEALMPRNRIVELAFRWMLPEWDTFTDSFIFTMQWRAFLHRIRGLFISSPSNGHHKARARPDNDSLRLILAAWIHNVCAVAGEHRGQWDWAQLDGVISVLKDGDGPEQRDAPARINTARPSGPLDHYEAAVAKDVRELFEWTHEDLIRFGRASVARHWLETFLPALMSPEFLPPEATERLRKLLSKDKGKVHDVQPLGEVWELRKHLMWQRRHALVRDEVKISTAYAQMEELYNSATGQGALECAHWLEDSCAQWFKALKDEAPR